MTKLTDISVVLVCSFVWRFFEKVSKQDLSYLSLLPYRIQHVFDTSFVFAPKVKSIFLESRSPFQPAL